MTYDAPHSPPAKNGLALAALILGIAGLLLGVVLVGGLLGIVALILGIVALKNPERRGMAIGGIITGALAIPMMVLGLLIMILLPSLSAARNRARETAVASQLRMIDNGIMIYAADFGGRMPPDIAACTPYLGGSPGSLPRLIHDPRGNTPMYEPAPGVDLRTQQAEIEAHCDFYYAGAGLKAVGSGASDLIVLYDKGIYGKRRVVTFGDGHVAVLAEASPDLKSAVARNNAVRAAMNAPPLPLDLLGPPLAAPEK